MRSIVLPFVGLFLLGLILCQRPAFGQSRTLNLGGSGSRSLGGGVSGGTRNFGGAGSGAMGQLGAGTQIGDNMPTGIGEVDSSDRFVRDVDLGSERT